jgi:methylenetetrahydrofolate dehydrogenase (NADP+)/methenyltetrahydrofolate cyclohydrolase
MPATLIDGKAIAEQIRAELAPRVAAAQERLGRPPALAIVLVGDDPGSEIYVGHKLAEAEAAGIAVTLHRIGAAAALAEVLDCVERFNADPAIDGILVQSPLPAPMGPGAERAVFDTIAPGKDVDGFSPVSAGKLVHNEAALRPCTPAGIVEMLERSGVAIAGKRAVVVGRSDIVGKPMALLLLHRDATVTICHSKTRDLGSITREADLLVVAAGRPALIAPADVKPGAVVVDVGMNRLADAAQARAILAAHPKRLAVFERRGTVLVGDVHPDAVETAGMLTPVPGGVGPLTVAMLLANTVQAAEMHAK